MTTTAAKQTEKQFEAAVVEYARLSGWHAYHPYDSRRSEAGFPDLTLVRAGTVVFAELKTERGRLSSAQCKWIEELTDVARQNDGVHVRVWRPRDWNEIEALLSR